MPQGDTVFISCGIFQEELRYLEEKGLFDGNIIFLDAALHVNFDKLKAHLEQALEKANETGKELRVLYGHCATNLLCC